MKKSVIAGHVLAPFLIQILPFDAGSAQAYGRDDVWLLSNTGTLQVCPNVARSHRADRLSQALGGGFGVQYWGDDYSADMLSLQSHGLLVIEAAKVGALFSDTGREDFFTAEEITKIRRAGTRPVLAYLNTSKIEDYRDYWVDLTNKRSVEPPLKLPEWVGPREVHGEILAAYWTKGWQEILFKRVDRLMAQGFDGLFLDDVLQYYSHAFDKNLVWPGAKRPKDGPGSAADFAIEMMHLVEMIAARARKWNCNAMIIVNNGAFIGRDALEAQPTDGPLSMFHRYRNSIDAILVENVLSDGTHPHTLEALTEDFLANDIPVLSLEFMTEFPSSSTANSRNVILTRARNLGFSPYVADDNLFDRLYPAIVTHPKRLLFP